MSREHHDDPPDDISRRDFLRYTGASIALAGLDGCTRMPAEHILPYVDQRPELTPGVPQHYATAMMLDGYATGLIVESHVGRPTKVEGNPDHPASLGAAGPLEQASVLQLYDPDRAKVGRLGTEHAEWTTIASDLSPSRLHARAGARGAGLRILIEPTSSSLDEELLAQVLSAHPDARIHMYAPLMPDGAPAAPVVHYDFSAADVIVAVDSDFLAGGPFHLRYARQFADGRRLAKPGDGMNRLYAIESTYTATGSAADHRFAVRPSDVARLLGALRDAVAGNAAPTANAPAWIAAIARDLRAHAGRSVVVVGDRQPASVRALGDEINAAVGATGRTTWYAQSPLIGRAAPIHPFGELVDALRAREVDTLVIVGGNPSYTTPASLGLSALIRATPNAGYVGLYENETARDARWFVPMSHYLEAWGDARAYDGTVSIVQPLVRPLYHSVAPCEVYAALAGRIGPEASCYALLQASWKSRSTGDADAAFVVALQRGVVPATAFAPNAAPPPVLAGERTQPRASASANGTVDVIYLADGKTHDGAFSNNGWLQELPASITQITWGNAALVSPSTAARIGVATGDALTLAAGDRRLVLPAFVLPGHADDTVSVHFGYGRAGGESLARGVGASAYHLWPAIGLRWESGVSANARGTLPARPFAIAQAHATMDDRHPVRTATLDEYRASPARVGGRRGRVLSLYPEPEPPAGLHGPNQWAMTIDPGTCIGCGACVVACQAENNSPVVGAEEVSKGREMQWMRIDRYFEPRASETDALMQPMLCQHCEKAPCEYVCPVEATVHSADGLNEMIYNRCVGTRFCSNNCPYKVRHFNWFDYNRDLSETEMMVKNPDVTVRERGVMEKCTFCVQRIREGEIAAGRDGRDLRGSEVRTACQQSCPTNAIVFGSLTEPDSEMVRRREQPRAYAVLDQLGTEPRVRYLARIRNVNPELGGTA